MTDTTESTAPVAFDLTQASVGDVVVLRDGTTITLAGICISSELGNAVLPGTGGWIDAAMVVGKAS